MQRPRCHRATTPSLAATNATTITADATDAATAGTTLVPGPCDLQASANKCGVEPGHNAAAAHDQPGPCEQFRVDGVWRTSGGYADYNSGRHRRAPARQNHPSASRSHHHRRGTRIAASVLARCCHRSAEQRDRVRDFLGWGTTTAAGQLQWQPWESAGTRFAICRLCQYRALRFRPH